MKEIVEINGIEFYKCYGKARGKAWDTIYYPVSSYDEQLANKKPKSDKKVIEDACDKLWAKIVKDRGGRKCAKCGRTLTLNAHHIIGRRNKRLRWDLDNGICLCASCHTLSSVFSAHQTPDLFQAWLEKQQPDIYDKLRMRANVKGQKQDIGLVYKYLKQEELK